MGRAGAFAHPPFWYFATARLCSINVAENCDVPSPRDTI
jgi:hypothetical protein